MEKEISHGDWQTIVESIPIPSVDIIPVLDDGILLAKRTNEPAKGEWFVPGGRIQKGERLTEAVHRIAADELGVDVGIIESLGAFDHLYETSDVGSSGKHYIAHGYVVDVFDNSLILDSQHRETKCIQSTDATVHEYVQAYLHSADSLEDELG